MIFRQLWYLIKNAGNNLWTFRGRNLISVLIIGFSFLVIGIFLALSNNLTYLGERLSNNLAISFFLEKNLKDEELEFIKSQILASELVEEVTYVSSEDAWNRFAANFPELKDILDNLNSNPFPPSYEVRLTDKILSLSAIVYFMENIKSLKGVIDFQFNQEWVEKMDSLSRIVRAIGFFFGGILILASFFIISNVVRLNVLARKNEIEILRLVGATNTYIRIPFLVEGFVLGLLGSLISLIILFIMIKVFPIFVGSSLGAAKDFFSLRPLTIEQSIWLIVGGVVIGILGSITSISRFLRI
ncbi:MAG: permease-like cell division protein FtsX [Acidobacteriota bacterium]|nr:permease-like cell division protein FtsX [Acidobacteriota bacterium]MDW3228887.1 permease-like cell division protein FtsX [Acidobacteriota bacterium]